MTSKQDAASIIDQQKRLRTNTLQLVDAVPFQELRVLRTELPGIRLVQVIHVRDAASVEEACSVAPLVDALLLDSGNPSLPVKVLGGTGNTHDWKLSRDIVDRSGKPVFLAGGLKPENVRQAIEQVHPFAVDVCSGLRINGLLDEKRVELFFRAVNASA